MAIRGRKLTTTAEVIDAIGIKRLKDLTGRSSQSITNDRSSDHFPPHTYLAMTAELERIGCYVPRKLLPKLWNMIEPQQTRAA
jgi:hypothetical protein